MSGRGVQDIRFVTLNNVHLTCTTPIQDISLHLLDKGAEAP